MHTTSVTSAPQGATTPGSGHVQGALEQIELSALRPLLAGSSLGLAQV
jgi:hypothetical protein